MKEKNRRRDLSLLRRTDTVESVGVFDIGSNSVRFVAYDLSFEPPLPFFNGKVTCGLGRDLEKTNHLSKKGMKRAVKALKGFKMLSEALNVNRVRAIATAAIRDAADGPEFARKLEKKLKMPIEVLSGEDEARYSALGIISAFDDAKGVIADLGGGSLELARIEGENISDAISFPLGVLRLAAHAKDARAYIMERLAGTEQRFDRAGTLYAIGGTWRAFAEAHQTGDGILLPHSHGYEMDAAAALAFTQQIVGKKGKYLAAHYAVEKKRAKLLPYAGLVLSCLLEKTGAEKVVFSNAGLRDGIVRDMAGRGG